MDKMTNSNDYEAALNTLLRRALRNDDNKFRYEDETRYLAEQLKQALTIAKDVADGKYVKNESNFYYNIDDWEYTHSDLSFLYDELDDNPSTPVMHVGNLIESTPFYIAMVGDEAKRFETFEDASKALDEYKESEE